MKNLNREKQTAEWMQGINLIIGAIAFIPTIGCTFFASKIFSEGSVNEKLWVSSNLILLLLFGDMFSFVHAFIRTTITIMLKAAFIGLRLL